MPVVTAVLADLVHAIQEQDLEAFGRLFADAAVMHEPMRPEPARGRTAIIAGESALLAAFGDIEVRVRNVVSTIDQVLAEVVMTAVNDGPLDLGQGTVEATGRRIEVPMVWALDIDPGTGQIVEERDYFDPGLIMRQLGL
ncbi:nuclear transport factor 2 family protein [Nocardioides sp. GCM10027113]|uniref:nuclear transport factor 2 family protein n=1 Tax=unclassified Nocardioides TaxID=2615069 RepID=UPI00360C131E